VDGRCELALTSHAQGSVTIAALLYLYMRHNRNFYFVRNMFMIAMAIALVGYIVFRPPRPASCGVGIHRHGLGLHALNVYHTSAR